MPTPLRLGFLASHAGSSMRAIVGAIGAGELDATAAIVISNNADAPALAFALASGVAGRHISARSAGSEAEADRLIAAALAEAGVNLVVLSGYLRMVGPLTLARYQGRILNIHPALLPKYGGKGMYGRFVHEAVLSSGDAVSGASVHLVDEEYDHGPVVSQKTVPIVAGDTAETLRDKVIAIEGALFVETLQKIAARGGEIVP
ncbi:MAG TPA: phosphoribosylglycinamide formyltransferase [Caulobacteraceae bacterium]|jgi:phosphoribosylglycinamide formyltransferase-1|nr:phosphoribosylglycinamide formyltransferase [Caulobacteraceae bacterium]